MKPAAASLKKPALSTADAALAFATGGANKAQVMAEQGEQAKTAPKSGKVPANDVRLTANIRGDLHLKLKTAAANRQAQLGRGFSMGELIEELIEKHL